MSLALSEPMADENTGLTFAINFEDKFYHNVTYHGYHSFSQKTSNTTASYYYFNSKLKFFFNVWEANSVETITSMINAMCVLQWPIRGSPPPTAKGVCIRYFRTQLYSGWRLFYLKHPWQSQTHLSEEVIFYVLTER